MKESAPIEDRIEQKIEALSQAANEIPGVVIVNRLPTLAVAYMSDRGKDYFGLTVKQLQDIGEDYHLHFFNPEDAVEYIPRIMAMIEQNDIDEVVSFFQQVRRSPDDEWTWHLSTTKIFMRGDDGLPLLAITVALPVDPLQHVTKKVDRLLEENIFLRKHYAQFAKLTDREREVLKLLALSRSAPEIADALFISQHTVESHRKNIRKKLGISSAYELTMYAHAFDLI